MPYNQTHIYTVPFKYHIFQPDSQVIRNTAERRRPSVERQRNTVKMVTKSETAGVRKIKRAVKTVLKLDEEDCPVIMPVM